MTETEKMRAILNERGIEYRDVNSMVTDIEHDGIKTRVYDYDDGPDYQLCVEQKWLTAEEAVRVALGARMYMKVYLVETSDELIESWYPIGVYLHREAAEDCVESLRGEHVGIRHFARVVELKVTDE